MFKVRCKIKWLEDISLRIWEVRVLEIIKNCGRNCVEENGSVLRVKNF